MTLQLPLGLLEKIFVSPRFFSPRAIFLRSTFWIGSSGRFPFSPPPRRGRVLYVYLLAPDVLLDYLLVLDGVLADPYLFLDHRTLLVMTSSSVTGNVISSSPISASEASRPSTGTRSTLTSSCRIGTLLLAVGPPTTAHAGLGTAQASL